MINIRGLAAALGAAALVSGGATACATGSATKVSSSASAQVQATHSARPKATTAKPRPAAAPLTGTVGTTFEVSGTDGNDNTTHYKVDLVKWLPVAAPDNSFDAAPGGQFIAAAEIRLTGVSGSSQGDADDSTQMISSTGHVAESNDGGIAAGTDFNSGSFSVAPGETEVGYVSFTAPDSQKINTIQWSDGDFMGGPVVTWKVTP
jgi:hypothetical protein